MHQQFHPEEYTLNEVELRVLNEQWTQGELNNLIELIGTFVQDHAASISAQAGPNPTNDSLLEAIRQLILDKRSINLSVELRDQLREIQNEIWYWGERGHHDRHQIQHEWTKRHAHNWRRWRLKVYLFIVDHTAESLLAGLTWTR